MYCEEKVIEGILHYRNSPHIKWTAYSVEQVTERYLVAQEAFSKAKDIINNLRDKIQEHTSWDLR